MTAAATTAFAVDATALMMALAERLGDCADAVAAAVVATTVAPPLAFGRIPSVMAAHCSELIVKAPGFSEAASLSNQPTAIPAPVDAATL